MNLKPETASFARRTTVRDVGGVRLVVLPSPAPGIVSLRGSFAAYPDFAHDQDLVLDVITSMLDKGTRSRDQFELADLLEPRGAQRHYDGDGYRVRFSGRALREDLGLVLDVVADELRHPRFDPAEFGKAKERVRASLQQAMDQTGAQAGAALVRRLYPSDHPNFSPRHETQLDQLDGLEVDDLRRFHDRHFGARQLILALAGDVDADEAAALVEQHLGDWPDHETPASFAAEALLAEPAVERVAVPGKANADVRLGHGLHLRRTDAAFVPLYLAAFALGGNFSARLMTEVRDEQGLTYGIGAAIHGVTPDHDGHFGVRVTLSPENMERGVAATRAVVADFVEGGMTADELDEKQTTVTGSFEVGLATTGGLAATVLRAEERGFGPGYLDRFPDLVRGVTLDEANTVLREHLRPQDLVEVRAGDPASLGQ